MSGPSQCNNCTREFGFFRRVRQCPSCKAALCKDCIKYNIDGLKEQVCRKCFQKATAKERPSSGRISPPANFKRQLAKQQQLAAVTVKDPQDEEIVNRLQGLRQSNQSVNAAAAATSSQKPQARNVSVDEIQRRMEKLKGPTPTITDEELEARLWKLKDKPRPAVIKVHSIKRKDTTTSSGSGMDGDEIKTLIQQYTQELDIENDASSSADDEGATADELIQLAQAELKAAHELQNDSTTSDNDVTQNQQPEESSERTDDKSPIASEPMDSETADLIKRILEEDRLEQGMRDAGISSNLPASSQKNNVADEEDDLPWCFMCNDDATLKCFTCEDLYCNKCFKIAHDKYERQSHNYEKYKGKAIPGY